MKSEVCVFCSYFHFQDIRNFYVHILCIMSAGESNQYDVLAGIPCMSYITDPTELIIILHYHYLPHIVVSDKTRNLLLRRISSW